MYLVHEKIYVILSEILGNKFQSSFGETFEEYIEMLLSDLGDVKILNEDEIKEEYHLHDKEVCDFLLEFPDCFLLLEVKAVQYTKRILSLDTLISANSSKKIAKAYVQFSSTGNAIEKESLKSKLTFCITFGQMYYPNLDIFYQNVINPNMNLEIEEVGRLFNYLPQTFSIDEFEELIAIIISEQISPMKLFNEMNDAKVLKLQGWHTFL